MEHLLLQRWQTAQATVRGRSHRKEGVLCQDKTCAYEDGRLTVVALADGAGSRRRSDEGAGLAVETVAGLLADRFDEVYESQDGGRLVLDAVLRALAKAAAGVDVGEFASTLLFAAVQSGRFLAGHLGDGVIGLVNGGDCSVLSGPDRGEYANQTYFTTDADAESHLRLYRGPAPDGFILMSDGAAQAFYSRRDNALAPAVRKVLAWPESYPSAKVSRALQENLEWIAGERTADDCSLVIMKRVVVEAGELLGRSSSFRRIS